MYRNSRRKKQKRSLKRRYKKYNKNLKNLGLKVQRKPTTRRSLLDGASIFQLIMPWKTGLFANNKPA